MFSIDGPYWTLGVEFCFYVFMLASAFVWRSKYAWRWAAAMLAVAWLWKLGVFFGVPLEKRFFNAVQLPGALDEFALGALVALLLHYGKLDGLRTRRWQRTILIVASGGLFAVTCVHILRSATPYWQSLHLVVWGKTLFCLAFALLIAGRCTAPAAAARMQPMALLGKSSFSFYLYHVPAFLLVHKVWPQASVGEWAVAAIAAACLLSAMSYMLVEKRFSLKA